MHTRYYAILIYTFLYGEIRDSKMSLQTCQVSVEIPSWLKRCNIRKYKSVITNRQYSVLSQ